jgi:hypothetical protein
MEMQTPRATAISAQLETETALAFLVYRIFGWKYGFHLDRRPLSLGSRPLGSRLNPTIEGATDPSASPPPANGAAENAL